MKNPTRGLSISQFSEKIRELRKPKKPKYKPWSTTMGAKEKALSRLRNDIQSLTDEELRTIVVNELIRRNESEKWFKQSRKTMEETKKMIEDKGIANQKKTEEIKKAMKKPLYKFRTLAQLASHMRKTRIDKLMMWSLKDLREVFKEVTSMKTLKGVPNYRLEQSKQDLLYVINAKTVES